MTESAPKVSVIMPSYNVAPYIRECMESVIHQTLEEIEIICVDAGSTDGTWEILQEYAQNDARIKILRSDQKSYGYQMNLGLDAATGEYIGIVETDDYVDVKMFQTLYTTGAKYRTAPDIVKAAFYLFRTESGEVVKEKAPHLSFNPPQNPFTVYQYPLFLDMHPATVTGIYRREFLLAGNIRYVEAPGAGWADNPFFVETTCLADSIVWVPKCLYYYRQGVPGASSQLKDCTVPFMRLREILDFTDAYVKGHREILAIIYKRVMVYLRNALDSVYYDRDAVRPLIQSVLQRLDPTILEDGIFTEEERRRFAQFRDDPVETSCEEAPKVSVIIPVYNTEKYLRECLDSILAQTLKSLEVICVDDGSTDHSRAILQEYKDRDGRVKLLFQENSGAGTARNKGIEIAKGEFLIFLDSDDYFREDMFQSTCDKLEEEDSDIVVFLANRRNMQTGKVDLMTWCLRQERCPAAAPFSASDMPLYIFNTFQNYPWNKVFRHSFIKEYGLRYQEIERTNDMSFVCTALALAKKISVIREAFVTYRVGTGSSLQSTNARAPLAFWKAYTETKRLLEKFGIYEKYEQSFLNWLIEGAIYNLNSVQTDPVAYGDVLAKLKYHANDEFHFMDHPSYYYYDEKAYKAFKAIYRSRTVHNVQTPDITVIIPVLNARPYIRECVESVMEQAVENIEVICVDAGSTDGTAEILEEYAGFDDRIRIIRSDRKSYGYQVNLGLDAARGRYFGIVESDDYIHEEMYETLLALADENGLDAIKSDFSRFYGAGKQRKFRYASLLPDQEYYRRVVDPGETAALFNAYNLNTPGIYSMDMVRQHHIRLVETPGASFQDNSLWFQIFSHARRMYFLPRSFYMLRRDNAESSTLSKGKVFCMCEVYDYLRRTILASGDREYMAKYLPLCALYRFYNYEWNCNRIGEEYRLAFFYKFSFDFCQLRDYGELDESLFSEEQWTKLQGIMEDPRRYYYKEYAKIKTPEEELAQAQKKNVQLTKKLKASKAKQKKLKKSASYRIGRSITWLPRKVRGFFRCLQGHGVSYTARRVLVHLHLAEDDEKGK